MFIDDVDAISRSFVLPSELSSEEEDGTDAPPVWLFGPLIFCATIVSIISR